MTFSEISLNGLAFGKENFQFLWEVLLRTSIMVCIIILGVKILGKRSVKQLSIFELVVIIGLGSAAGDPMFYKDVGILSAAVVFAVVALLYKIITFLVGRYHSFEKFFEGTPNCLVKEGRFAVKNFKKEALGTEELLASLRLKSVSQLGQVQYAFEENSGEISIFFYETEEVKFGLPILPGEIEKKKKTIETEAHYSCEFCGYTEIKTVGKAGKCKICKNENWVRSSNRRRIT